jgi:hypothetical protein
MTPRKESNLPADEANPIHSGGGAFGGGKSGEISVTVFVKSADGSDIASKLSGYFVLRGREYRFKAIAFGRIGGHNASVSISKKALDEISKMGIDTEELQLIIQRKLIEGDIVLPDGLKPPS